MRRNRWVLFGSGILVVLLVSGCTLLNQVPLASFSALPVTGEAPLTVQFNASGSSDPDGGSLSFSWRFGDGQSGIGEIIAHTFNDSGQFTVELTVTDDAGAQSTAYQTILVTDLGDAPVAQISASPTSGGYPLSVSFNGAASSDPDGQIVSYQWTFGDGSTGSGINTVHTYAAIGTYTATLTVTDNEGNTATRTIVIQVMESGGSVCG
jgi:PKD repeat protein